MLRLHLVEESEAGLDDLFATQVHRPTFRRHLSARFVRFRLSQIRADAYLRGHWPAGGCQSSTLFPSGSMTQPNFPYSESSVFSRTLQPSSRRTLTRAWRSSTR